MLFLFQGDKGDQGEMVRKHDIIKALCKNCFSKHKMRVCKENLSVLSSFKPQGDAGPEGPTGPRVSQTLNNMVLMLTHMHSIIIDDKDNKWSFSPYRVHQAQLGSQEKLKSTTMKMYVIVTELQFSYM